MTILQKYLQIERAKRLILAFKSVHKFHTIKKAGDFCVANH